MKILVKVILVFFIVAQTNAQELNATVTVNSDQIAGSNKQVFKTLERSLTEFINQKKWTNRNYKPQERVQCAFTLTIDSQSSLTDFTGNIQVQSSRPVYNSTYLTPVFNFKDNDLSFRYTEFENFQYNRNVFDSNLVSIIAFYVYTILGIDGDTYALNGGTTYYDEAENVMNQAQQGGYSGWTRISQGTTRYKLMTDILSNAFVDYRKALYTFHIQGLDVMYDDKSDGKKKIKDAINLLKNIYSRRPNAILIRTFMDSKADEIVDVFSGGPRMDVSQLRDDLQRMSPVNSTKWNKIK